MANNEQNTYAGGGAAIAAPTGNSIFDNFLKLANVAVAGVGSYEDIQDRRAAREIKLLNAAQAPRQALPASQANSPGDYLSNPQSIQALFFYGASFALIGGLSLWAIKKL